MIYWCFLCTITKKKSEILYLNLNFQHYFVCLFGDYKNLPFNRYRKAVSRQHRELPSNPQHFCHVIVTYVSISVLAPVVF